MTKQKIRRVFIVFLIILSGCIGVAPVVFCKNSAQSQSSASTTEAPQPAGTPPTVDSIRSVPITDWIRDMQNAQSRVIQCSIGLFSMIVILLGIHTYRVQVRAEQLESDFRNKISEAGKILETIKNKEPEFHNMISEGSKIIDNIEQFKKEINEQLRRAILSLVTIQSKEEDETPPELSSNMEFAIEQAMNKPEEKKTADDYVIMALRNKNVDERIELCSKAIDLKPDFTVAYMVRASTYDQKGMYELAINDSNRIIGLLPNEPIGYQFKGTSLLNNGQHSDALDVLSTAIKLDPIGFSAYSKRGAAYFAIGDAFSTNGKPEKAMENYGLAKKDYSKALSLRPNQQKVLYDLGCLYCVLGDKDMALKFLDKAANNGYSRIDIIRRHLPNRLAKLKDDPRFKAILKKIEDNYDAKA